MKKRFLALALGTLAFGVTLGGAKMGLGHQDALMVKAADQPAETVYKTLSFPDDNQSANQISGYDKEWTAKIGADSYTIKNFNNNSWKDKWNYIKCGRKNVASVASIETSDFIDKPISKVALKIGGIVASKVKTIKLLATDASGAVVDTIELTTKTVDTHDFVLKTPAANLKYKFVFDCLSNSKNGIVQVDQIDFYTKETTGGEPEPAKPATSVIATPKEGTTFYAGTPVSTSDFVFVGTDTDGKEVTLTGEITIENPLLVEGKNTIKFIYQSGETSVNFECEVNAIKTTIYAKTTDVQDIVVGKRILIAGKNGETVLGAETVINNKSVRASVAGAPKNNMLLPTEGFVPLIVLPAKNGSFALYDETAKGVLCATSSSDNIMGMETNFESMNENSFATITAGENKGEFVIKFSGAYTKNILSYNASNPRFACYGSTQSPTSIFVSSEVPVTFGTETWATSFMENMEIVCDPTGETALPETDWADIKSEFDALSIPDKMAIKYGTSDGTEMSKALKAYDFVVNKYVTYDDFLGRRTTTKANALMLPGATDSTTWSLVGIGTVTIAASASLLFFRRKKSN